MSVLIHLLDHKRYFTGARLHAKHYFSKYRKMRIAAVILQSNPLGYQYKSVTVANFIGNAFMEQLDCEVR